MIRTMIIIIMIRTMSDIINNVQTYDMRDSEGSVGSNISLSIVYAEHLAVTLIWRFGDFD